MTQAGHHNTNIAHAEQVHMPVMILPTQLSRNASPGSAPRLDPSCYHLFVIAGEDFSTGRFLVNSTRALTEHTSDELKKRYQHLESADIDKLKNFPALFMDENAEIVRALPDQLARWGYLTDIRVQDNGIRIAFNTVMTVPQQCLNDNSHHFGIQAYGRMSELNRTHWALKRVNLFEAFNDAGINYLPYETIQGGVS